MRTKLILFLLMLTGSLAARAVTINGVDYEISGSTATVAAVSQAMQSLKIPASITYNSKQYPVKAIKANMSVSITNYITSVEFSEGLETIGNAAFKYDKVNLKTLTIPNSVKTIGSDAFNGNKGLNTVTLGTGVTSVGRFAFYFCLLNETSVIECKATTPPTCDAEAFHPSTYQNATLKVPAGCKQKYRAAAGWAQFTKIVEAAAEVLPTGITVTPSSMTINVGETRHINCTVTPSNATDKSIYFSNSNKDIAEFTADSDVTGLKPGTATITFFTKNDIKATCVVTVKDAEVLPTGISISPSSVSMTVGDTKTLSATVSPSNATDKTVTWSSSSSSVASVNSSGVVTAKAAGTTTITAKTSNGKTATCLVTVSTSTVLPTSISMAPSNFTLEKGKTQSLKVTFTPSDVTDKTITWSSSNPSVASVSTSGVVTGKAVGTATITAKTTNGKTATSTVTVKDAEPSEILPTGITVTPSSMTLTVGETKTITVRVTPADATDQRVWVDTYNPDIAKINVDGSLSITGLKPGTATFAFTTVNDITTVCVVTVVSAAVPPTSIAITPATLTLDEGKSQALSVTFTPSNASDKNITWESTNTSIVTVNASGVVTAKAPGSARIIATTSNGLSATCRVNVNSVGHSLKILLNNEESSGWICILNGNDRVLKAVFDGSDVSAACTWSSSNKDVGTVKGGVVTLMRPGETTIEAKYTHNGVTYQAETELTATDSYVEILEPSNVTMESFTARWGEPMINYDTILLDVEYYNTKTNEYQTFESYNQKNIGKVREYTVRADSWISKRYRYRVSPKNGDSIKTPSPWMTVTLSNSGVDEVTDQDARIVVESDGSLRGVGYDESAVVSIYNLSGQQIYSGPLSDASIPKGIYIAVVDGKTYKLHY